MGSNEELSELPADTFAGIEHLENLDLSGTALKKIPTEGLSNLNRLDLRKVPTLKKLPPVMLFTQLQKAYFTYPHHCCLFKHLDIEGHLKQAVEVKRRMCKVRERQRTKRSSDERGFMDQFLYDLETAGEIEELMESDPPPYKNDELGFEKCVEDKSMEIVRQFYFNITCKPEPDALNPCENIVGYPLLRKAIWVVWIAAIIVLFMAYEKRMRVHYLFMFNLSVADLITGVYLAFLAFEDKNTADEYYRYAVAWQTGWGCATAGFLAVFASQLSITSMFFIAFEMSYNTRFGMGLVMQLVGYLFAIVMAALPLMGISSYSTSSICLPLRVETFWDKMYIMSGLAFNIVAFSGMVVCYVFIFYMLKIERPDAPSRPEDKAVIIKMALLILTDMICWFPTLFFGLTAALGYPLITISNAKIFLVFFFPINSFMNPFLYVFFTKVCAWSNNLRRKVIQRHVRRKATAIKRIVSTPVLNTLSQFYHSNPPGDRRRTNDEAAFAIAHQHNYLGVTQLTDAPTPNHTPRGSSDVGSFDMGDARQRTPRVSFQDEIELLEMAPVEMPPAPLSPPLPPLRSNFKTRVHDFWKKFTSIPEVSEHSGSESVNNVNSAGSHTSEHEERPAARSTFSMRPSFFRRRRDSSAKSSHDSGRSSMTSISTSGHHTYERLSLSTAQDTESDEERVRQPPPLLHRTSEPLLKLHNSPKSALKTRLGSRMREPQGRRQSMPLTTPLLVVSECSDTSTGS